MGTLQLLSNRRRASQLEAESSLKAIAAISACTAKIAVQGLNCGANGLTPSLADVFTFLEDTKMRHNAINNGVREFLAGILRDPNGTESEFKAQLTEPESITLFVCINEKIPRPLLRSLWKSNERNGAGLVYALLQHAISPEENNITLKRQIKFFDTKALTKDQNFQAVYLQLQPDMRLG